MWNLNGIKRALMTSHRPKGKESPLTCPIKSQLSHKLSRRQFLVSGEVWRYTRIKVAIWVQCVHLIPGRNNQDSHQNLWRRKKLQLRWDRVWRQTQLYWKEPPIKKWKSIPDFTILKRLWRPKLWVMLKQTTWETQWSKIQMHWQMR